jgi:hypothetical protein
MCEMEAMEEGKEVVADAAPIDALRKPVQLSVMILIFFTDAWINYGVRS